MLVYLTVNTVLFIVLNKLNHNGKSFSYIHILLERLYKIYIYITNLPLGYSLSHDIK